MIFKEMTERFGFTFKFNPQRSVTFSKFYCLQQHSQVTLIESKLAIFPAMLRSWAPYNVRRPSEL